MAVTFPFMTKAFSPTSEGAIRSPIAACRRDARSCMPQTETPWDLSGRQVLECLAQPRAEQLGSNGCGSGYGRGDSDRLARTICLPKPPDPGDDGRLQSTDYANSITIAFAQPCADCHADTFTFSDTQLVADCDTHSNRNTHTIAFAQPLPTMTPRPDTFTFDPARCRPRHPRQPVTPTSAPSASPMPTTVPTVTPLPTDDLVQTGGESCSVWGCS